MPPEFTFSHTVTDRRVRHQLEVLPITEEVFHDYKYTHGLLLAILPFGFPQGYIDRSGVITKAANAFMRVRFPSDPPSVNDRPATFNELKAMSDREIRKRGIGSKTLSRFRSATQTFMEKFREAQQNPQA